jgi:heavy metal efflux system protein
VTPVLASLLLPLHIAETETIVVRMLRSIYSPVLRWSLANRKVMLAIGLAFLAATGLLWTRLGSEFLPALEEGN